MTDLKAHLVALVVVLSILAGLGLLWLLVLLLAISNHGACLIFDAPSWTPTWDGFFTVFAGVLLGLATALLVERAKKPSLRIDLADSAEHELEGRKLRSVHVEVAHCGVAFFDRLLLPSPALACVAKLRIMRDDGSDVFPAPFEARWTGSQQPPEFRQPDGGIYPSVYEMLKRRDIFPLTREKIDLCIKYEGESECYVFNNASYFFGYCYHGHKVPHGVYVIEVTVSSGDITVSRRVRLRNDLPRAEFRVESLEQHF